MTKLLVIEDSEDLLRDVVEMLSLEGFETYSAENGQVGVEMALKHQPDLILCDIRMPLMNGYEVLKEIRKQPGMTNLPFIFLTARTGHDEIRFGMGLGADDYLTKPFTAEELIKAINARLRRSDAARAETQRQLDDLRKSIALALPHELRTPLNAILGFSEILITDSPDLGHEKVQEMAKHINKAARRLFDLTERYVIYTNLELLGNDNDRLAMLRRGRTNFAGAIIDQQAREQARLYNREDDLHVEVTFEDDVVAIEGDNLTRVIQELLDNAFKFSSRGTPVHVRYRVEDGEISVVVEDKGRGMDAHAINEIGAYMQFDRNKYEQQGIGYGLAISRRMVELHGGDFQIQSEPDAFTRVSLRLPLAQEALA